MTTLAKTGPRAALKREAPPGRRNLPLALMLVVFGVYLLAMSGHTYSPDEETMLAASQALVVDSSWALPPSRALVEVTGADGRRYSQYGPGQSLAAVPWVVAGRTVGGLFPRDQSGFPLRLILASYNALVVAGICALLAATGLALGYSRRASLLAGALLAFGTFLWPHSRTFFSEPLVALCLFGSFYLALLGRSSERKALLYTALSGLLFAGAVATKVQYAAALPAFLVYLAWLGFAPPSRSASPRGVDPISGAAAPEISPASLATGNWQLATRNLASWLVGLGLGLVPLFLYNLAIFGGAFTTGYGADLKGTFKTPLLEGVSGLLLSPGKGLLWYALPLALSVWGFRRFARKHPAEAALVLLLFVSLVGFFGLYAFWPGDGSWGPRYMIPLLPFLMLPSLPAIQWTLQGSDGAGRRVSWRLMLLSVAAGLGFLVNLLGVLVNFDTYINVVNDDATRYWRADASPILGHARLLGQRARELASRVSPPPGTVLFTGGFSYSEGDKSKGELLPRWTTGEGTMRVKPNGGSPVALILRLADHRPPPLPRANVLVLVNGSQAQLDAALVQGEPASTDYTLSIPPQGATLTIRTETWNPSKVQEGGRDEDLGVMLQSISAVEGGQPAHYSMADAMPAPPYYPQPRWYYDPGTHHPADLWFSYMAETGMGRKAMLALSLPVVLVAAACIFLGWRRLRAA